jgi:DNA recombination protein RmuC
MERVLFVLNGTRIAVADLLLGAAGLALVLMAWSLAARSRASNRETLAATERQREMLRAMQEISRQNAGLTGSVHGVAEVLGSRQADLARLVAERLDTVGTRVGAGLEASGKTAGEHLAKLNERLAVIDAAQARVAALTQEVVGLKDILATGAWRLRPGPPRSHYQRRPARRSFRISVHAFQQHPPRLRDPLAG